MSNLKHCIFRLVAFLPMERSVLASPRCEKWRTLVFRRAIYWYTLISTLTHNNNKVKELLHEVVSKLEVIIGNCYWTPSWYKIQGCAWRASGDGQKPSDPSSRLPEQVFSTDHPSVRLPVFSSVRMSVCLSVRSFQSLCSILLFATASCYCCSYCFCQLLFLIVSAICCCWLVFATVGCCCWLHLPGNVGETPMTASSLARRWQWELSLLQSKLAF